MISVAIIIYGALALFTYSAFVVSSVHVQDPLVLASEPQHGQTAQKYAITPELSTFIDGLLETDNIPGISLGVVHTRGANGGDPFAELDAWGRQTEDGDGHDLSPDALFGIASCSKAFLASAMGLLMDDFAHGRNVTPLPANLALFDWDTKVRDLLPEDWVLQDEWASEKTNIRDLLGHVSGMPRHDYSYAPDDTLSGVVRNLRNLRPAYELRKKWSYNNQMYKVGAYLVSKYADMSYPSFASTRLFEPLNMTSTTFWPEEAAASGKLTQTWTKFGRRIPFWFTNDVVELIAGAGGVISSAEDLIKWVGILLNEGVSPASNETVIPRSVFDEMTTAHAVMSGKGSASGSSIMGYGMGWMRSSYRGHEIVAHTGGLPGISTLVAFLPEDGLGVVALANADEKDNANQAILRRIVEDVVELSQTRVVDIADANGQASPLDVPSFSYVETTRRESAAVSQAIHAPDLGPYVGTYGNAGYGAITLCAPTSDSHYCTDVLRDFAPFLAERSFSAEALTLYAAYPRIWSTHVRMLYRDEETFDLDFTALFPHGFGLNTSAFETAETGESEGRALFVVEEKEGEKTVKGFGLIIDESAVEERRRSVGGGVQQYTDAWFEKVL